MGGGPSKGGNAWCRRERIWPDMMAGQSGERRIGLEVVVDFGECVSVGEGGQKGIPMVDWPCIGSNPLYPLLLLCSDGPDDVESSLPCTGLVISTVGSQRCQTCQYEERTDLARST
jgi:hypothetical protein